MINLISYHTNLRFVTFLMVDRAGGLPVFGGGMEML